MNSLFDAAEFGRTLQRIRSIAPDRRPLWGRMSAPQMIAHLTDQMHHVLGDETVAARHGPLRWPPVRFASIYLLPWPKGRIKGPPEAFVTQPKSWDRDVRELEALLERFAARDLKGTWPDHALFGRMNARDWGVFVHKHFDHHLRQFGA